MPEINNNFSQGKMNKDLDERIVPSGEYRDAKNIQVSTSEEMGVGTVQNILGNDRLDTIITGTYKCVGVISDEKKDVLYWFVHSEDEADAIIEYKREILSGEEQHVITPIIVDRNKDVLHFTEDIITGINIIDNLLFWTDNKTEPKKINIDNFKLNNHSDLSTHSDFYVKEKNIGQVLEEHITVIKQKPTSPPDIEVIKTSEFDILTFDFKFSDNNNTQLEIGDTVEIRVERKDPIPGSIVFRYQYSWTTGTTFLVNAVNSPYTLPANYQVKLQVTSWPATEIGNPGYHVYTLEVVEIMASTPLDLTEYNIIEFLMDENIFHKKLPRFSYRYKYQDGEFSAFGPFSQPIFNPGVFSMHATKSPFNTGMQNYIKSINIRGFVPYDIPNGVVEVELLYKEDGSPVVYSIEKIGNEDERWSKEYDEFKEYNIYAGFSTVYDIANSNKGVYQLTNESIFAAVPENQMLRAWDNVPTKAMAQEITSNRIVYGNYVQNVPLKDKHGKDVKLNISAQHTKRVFKPGDELDFTQGKKSIKSQRIYQVGVVLGDKYGRETPIITDTSAIVTIPYNENPNATSTNPNGELSKSIIATYSLRYNNGDSVPPANYPEHIKYLKYYVKETSGEYYNLVLDRVYKSREDGNLWLSFPSSERNKVSEDDYLILKKQVDKDEQVQEENKFRVIDIKNEAPDFIKRKYSEIGAGNGNGSITNLFTDNTLYPVAGSNTLGFSKTFWMSNETNPDLELLYNPTDNETQLFLSFQITNGDTNIVSKKYSVESVIDDTGLYVITLGEDISARDSWIQSSLGVLDSSLVVKAYKEKLQEWEEFQGRFFVKITENLVTQKYLEPSLIGTTSLQVAEYAPLFFLSDYPNNQAKIGQSWARYNGVVLAGTSPATQVLDKTTAWGNSGYGSILLNKWTDTDSTPGNFIFSSDPHAITSNWFIDAMYAASMQPVTDINNTSEFDVNQSGHLWRAVTSGANSSGKAVVDSFEGIVTVSGSYTGGSFQLRSGLVSQGGVNDDTYEKSDGGGSGGHFMHLSYGPVGEDLHDGNFSETFVGTTDESDIDTWDLQNIINHGSSIAPDTATSNEDPTVVEKQWNPTSNNAANQNFIDKITTIGSKFKFEGDSSNTIYTILKVTPRRVYNHTPWRKQKYWDGDSGTYKLTGYSVEEAWDTWEDNQTTANFTALKNKIKNFGRAHNRRMMYIIELDKDPQAQSWRPDDSTNLDNETSTGMQFIEAIYDDDAVLASSNPAVFETEPKEGVDLDIFYEASGSQPFVVNASSPTFSQELTHLLAPIGTKVRCNKTNSMPLEIIDFNWDFSSPGWTYGDEQVQRILSWNDNEIEIWPGLWPDVVTLLNDGSTASATSLSDQSQQYRNKTLFFIREDLSYTSVNIYSVTEIKNTALVGTSDKITKFRITITPKWTSLPYYNCISFGNGVESNRIRDDFNQKFIANGVRASAPIPTDVLKEERRKNGLIYSGIYNSTSGVNNLNQFIQAEAITKDLNPTYGSIQKLFQRRISLVAFCEDRVVDIVAGKDTLYNADGNTQLVATNRVLGDANPFVGDYGISTDPSSFAKESYRAYFTDRQRGAVLRLSMDGITPISDAGMHTYFKNILRDSGAIIGSYDDYKRDYNITILAANPEILPNPLFRNSTSGEQLLNNTDFSETELGTERLDGGEFDTVIPNASWEAKHSTGGTPPSSPTNFEMAFSSSEPWNGAFLHIKNLERPDTTGYIENNTVDDLVIGETYEVSFVYEVLNEGLVFNVGGTTPLSSDPLFNTGTVGGITGTGVFKETFVATHAAEIFRFWGPVGASPGVEAYIDKFSVKRIKAKDWDEDVVGTWKTYEGKAEHISGTGYLQQTLPSILTNTYEYELTMDVPYDDGDLKLNYSEGNQADLDIHVSNNKGIIMWEQDEPNIDIIGIQNSNGTGTGIIDNIKLQLLARPSGWEFDHNLPSGNFGKRISYWGPSIKLFHKDSNSSNPITAIKTVDKVIEAGKLYDWSIDVKAVYAGSLEIFSNGEVKDENGNILTEANGTIVETIDTVGRHSGTLKTNASAGAELYIRVGDTTHTNIEFSDVSLKENVDERNRTVTFSEDVRGWTSFKSFIKENGVSMSNNYYTFDNGELWKHHSIDVDRNNFYGDQYESSVTTIFNQSPGVIKNFNTLNYEGTQSRIDQFTTETVELPVPMSGPELISNNDFSNITTYPEILVNGSFDEWIQGGLLTDNPDNWSPITWAYIQSVNLSFSTPNYWQVGGNLPISANYFDTGGDVNWVGNQLDQQSLQEITDSDLLFQAGAIIPGFADGVKNDINISQDVTLELNTLYHFTMDAEYLSVFSAAPVHMVLDDGASGIDIAPTPSSGIASGLFTTNNDQTTSLQLQNGDETSAITGLVGTNMKVDNVSLKKAPIITDWKRRVELANPGEFKFDPLSFDQDGLRITNVNMVGATFNNIWQFMGGALQLDSTYTLQVVVEDMTVDQFTVVLNDHDDSLAFTYPQGTEFEEEIIINKTDFDNGQTVFELTFNTPASFATWLNSDGSIKIEMFNQYNTGDEDKYIELTSVSLTRVIDEQNFTDGEFFNLEANTGWFVEDIFTDQQSGSLIEFIEKEGKWFNYIRGDELVLDTSAFNFQGIGVCNAVDIEVITLPDEE